MRAATESLLHSFCASRNRYINDVLVRTFARTAVSGRDVGTFGVPVAHVMRASKLQLLDAFCTCRKRLAKSYTHARAAAPANGSARVRSRLLFVGGGGGSVALRFPSECVPKLGGAATAPAPRCPPCASLALVGPSPLVQQATRLACNTPSHARGAVPRRRKRFVHAQSWLFMMQPNPPPM